MPSAKRRCLVGLLLFCVFYIALALYSESWLLRETEGRIADDFGIYYQAYLRARAGGNPYVPYKIGLSFIYHPFALTCVSIFHWHSVELAAMLWMAAGALAWVASLAVAIRLLQNHLAWEHDTRAHQTWVWLAALLMLAFAPAGESIHVGQINGFVVLCLILTYYCSEREGLAWEIASSVALSVAVLFKTSPIVLLLYFLALRRYRLALASIIAMAAFTLIAAIQFSPKLLVEFAHTILRIGSGIHYSFYNHSVLRIEWQVFRILGIHGVEGVLVRLLQIISGLSFALLFLTARLTVTRQTPARLLLFNLLLSLMVIASPIVWYHHSTFLLFPILVVILHQDPRVRWTGLVASLLIQSERVLEASGLPAGLAAFTGQAIILLVLILLYSRDRWPVLRPKLL
jgi:hypothetical protein